MERYQIIEAGSKKKCAVVLVLLLLLLRPVCSSSLVYPFLHRSHLVQSGSACPRGACPRRRAIYFAFIVSFVSFAVSSSLSLSLSDLGSGPPGPPPVPSARGPAAPRVPPRTPIWIKRQDACPRILGRGQVWMYIYIRKLDHEKCIAKQTEEQINK